MKIHEYQAKEIFAAHGIPVPMGKVARTAEEAGAVAQELGEPVVVKAQVLVGGRGKAGGVKLARDAGEARERADAILGMEIKGLVVDRVLVTPAVEIEREIYVGVVNDRTSQCPLLIVSAAGGIDIEQVARETPEQIHKLVIDPLYGPLEFQARDLAFQVAESPGEARRISAVIQKLYRAYIASDANLAEINPLVITPSGEVLAIDAKTTIDDNALFRQPAIAELRDLSAEDPSESEARGADLSFVKMEGDVGCIVNGAGLAMATMDLVKHYGGRPANFLDVGGSSNPEKIITAMRIILRDPDVRSILFNIFGGITRCDDVARGILQATSSLEVGVPIVVRLTGTNEEIARELLSGTDLVAAATMDEAVERAIESAKARGGRVG